MEVICFGSKERKIATEGKRQVESQMTGGWGEWIRL